MLIVDLANDALRPSEDDMVRLHFRIGDAFPRDDAVAQFLAGLCRAVNDITLTMRHMAAHMGPTQEPPDDQSGVSLLYLYRLATIYRESAKLLWKSLKDPQIESFLEDLSREGQRHLRAVRDSFSPWEGSFVNDKVKPIRDAASHYEQIAVGEIEACLERVADERSWIDLGQGTGTWYQFAEVVFTEHLLQATGRSERELKEFMTQLTQLVLAFTSFAREAVAMWISRVNQDTPSQSPDDTAN